MSRISFHIPNRVMRIAATAAAAMVISCVSSGPKQPAPVATPIPEPNQVTKAFPIDEPRAVVGEELKGSVLPQTASPPVLLGMSLDGTPVYLSDYYGKVVIASYWASWCPTCWSGLPQLNDLHAEYHGRNVEVIAINVGEVRSAIDSFLGQQQEPLRITIVSDRSEQASATQGVKELPTTLVFDAEGRISKRYPGVLGFNAQRIRGDIDRLLGNRS